MRKSLLFLWAAPVSAWAGGGDADAWKVALPLALFAGFSFYAWFRGWWRARRIEDTPTANIGTAAQGEVEIIGRADALNDKMVTCPLTGASCLWYSYKVQRHEKRGKHSRWVTVREGQSLDLFAVEDETGRAVVHPARAEVTIQTRREWRGQSPDPVAPFYESAWFGSYRYTEELILPGETVYVLGWFQTVDGTSRGPDVSERLRQLKSAPAELLARFDRDRDGEISGEEWDAARAVVEADVRAAALAQPAGPAVHTVTVPPDAELPFMISTIPQEELIRKHRNAAVLGLLGFLVLGGASVWFFFRAIP